MNDRTDSLRSEADGVNTRLHLTDSAFFVKIFCVCASIESTFIKLLLDTFNNHQFCLLAIGFAF